VPRFQVLRRIDAFVDCVAEVEAVDAEEAAAKANEDETKFEWKKSGLSQFDARLYVTLDAAGNEIESTQQGDF
jgi:UDP-N-acetylenolpyruvoylglucosamine reductase